MTKTAAKHGVCVRVWRAFNTASGQDMPVGAVGRIAQVDDRVLVHWRMVDTERVDMYHKNGCVLDKDPEYWCDVRDNLADLVVVGPPID